MNDMDRLLVEQACTRLIYRYAALMDAGDYEAVAKLFKEDASYARPSDPNSALHGREAILSEFKGRPARIGRHMVSNVMVEAESAMKARAHSRVTLYIGGAGEAPVAIERTLVGDFHDVIEMVGGDWQFAERKGSITLRG